MADAHKNFAYSTVATAPSPATSGTSLTLASGGGALFPVAPFNVTIWPTSVQPLATNAEIARCTAKSTDTLTILRAQEGSSARSVSTGDQIAATITAQTLVDAETFKDRGATGYRQLVRPPFVPVRVVNVTTSAQLTSAITGLTAGDYVVVQPGVYGGTEFSPRAVLASPGAVFEFLPGVIFYDAASTDTPLLLLYGASNIQMYGGEVINPSGTGCRIISCSNITWWGFTIHDCGESGLYVGTDGVINTNNSTGIDIDGESYNNGADPTEDPHPEVGTGMHAVYIGGGPGPWTTTGKFSVYVHDQSTGAGCSVGGFAANSEFWVKAERLTFNALSQIAGNAIQFFLSDSNNTVHHISATDCAGMCVQATGTFTGTVVEYAYADNCQMNPIQASPTPFETDAGITYNHTYVTSRASKPRLTFAPGIATANSGIVPATAAGVTSTTLLVPTFYPIIAPAALYKLVDLAVNITATVASSTIGIAIYSIDYNTALTATRVCQLNAALSGSAATGVTKGVVTLGAAGAGAPVFGGAYLDFTAHQYVVGVMTSTATTLALSGLNPPARLGALKWTTTARASTTDWPASFTSSSVGAISTSRVNWVGLINADGMNWL